MWLFPKKYHHEVFISHEVEVRPAIADELRTRLVDAGLDVWYSGDQLLSGDDLYKAIEDAIDQSRFGVVIFTNTFITRQWPLRELAWLEKKEKNDINVILPILHQMTVEELKAFSPRIASKYWIDGGNIDRAVKKILDQIHKEREKEKRRRRKFILLTSLFAFLLLILAGYVSFLILNHRPSSEQIRTVINERITDCLNTVAHTASEGVAITQPQIDSIWTVYENYKSYYRNEYEINNCGSIIRARSNVEDYIGQDPAAMRDQPGYGMDSVDMYWANKTMADGFRHSGFTLLNKRPLTFTCKGRKEGSLYAVDVTYANEIRHINVSLTLPSVLTGTKRHEMTLIGFAPSETYYFEEGSYNNWHFKKVE